MDSKVFDVEKLKTEVAAKNKRASKVSWAFFILFLLVGALWMWYAVEKVRDLQKTSDELNEKIITQQSKWDDLSKKVTESEQLLQAINPMLKKYGVLQELTFDNLNSDLVKQSLEANQEIQRIGSGNIQQRRNIKIEYRIKDVDNEKVGEALSEAGFNPKILKSYLETPTNLIAFGKNVKIEDLKLVSYILMRAGIEVKDFCKTSATSNSSLIQVISGNYLVNSPALTVDEIKNKEEKDFQSSCPQNRQTMP